MAEKPNLGTRQTDRKTLVWFGEIERKLAKLSMPTFTHHYFMIETNINCLKNRPKQIKLTCAVDHTPPGAALALFR
jgi:hypothetical protein